MSAALCELRHFGVRVGFSGQVCITPEPLELLHPSCPLLPCQCAGVAFGVHAGFSSWNVSCVRQIKRTSAFAHAACLLPHDKAASVLVAATDEPHLVQHNLHVHMAARLHCFDKHQPYQVLFQADPRQTRRS